MDIMQDDRIRVFGELQDLGPVYAVALSNGSISLEVITYGATLRCLKVPDSNGIPRDIVLGLDDIEEYYAKRPFYGATVGRYANRIGNASFELNGRRYELAKNDGPNHLHGGIDSFDRKNWEIASLMDNAVTLHLFSEDGDEGYPGDLDVYVTYELAVGSECGPGALRISYNARNLSKVDTICNLTNHSFFNLSGHDSGSVEGQFVKIAADCFTPVDSRLIPIGEIASVEGTPLDLRRFTKIGEHIEDEYDQLILAKGYDHNYVLTEDADWQNDRHMRLAAEAYSTNSGIAMRVMTDMPGMQFYTGNWIDPSLTGKNGAVYDSRHGFCFETQCFPDTPNKEDFPSAVLHGGGEYRSVTEYSFYNRIK